MRRFGAVVAPAGVALSVGAWAAAGVDRLPESDTGFLLALAAWTALVCVAILAGDSCDRGMARVLPLAVPPQRRSSGFPHEATGQ